MGQIRQQHVTILRDISFAIVWALRGHETEEPLGNNDNHLSYRFNRRRQFGEFRRHREICVEV